MTVVNYTIKTNETLSIKSGMSVSSVNGLDSEGNTVAPGRIIYMNTKEPKFEVQETYNNGYYWFRVSQAYPEAKYMQVRAYYGTTQHNKVWHSSELIPITSVYKFSDDITNQCILKFFFFDENQSAINHPHCIAVINQNNTISYSGDTYTEPFTSESGRILMRHPNNMGTIVCFTLNNKPRTLFVADAKYRMNTYTQWQRTYSDSAEMFNHSQVWDSGDTQYIYNQYINNKESYVAGASGNRNCAGTAPANLGPVTDKQLYDRFETSIINETAVPFTPERLTDLITESPMKEQVRGYRWWPGGLSIPTVYDCAMLYVEGDNIDSLDPTLSSNQVFQLGRPYSRNRFALGRDVVWTCQEYNVNEGWYLHTNGYFGRAAKNNQYGVIPVASM